MTFLAFRDDPQAFRASVYSVQIISEAARRVPREWLDEFPEIDWHGIRAIGNQTRHEYAGLRSLTIWEIMNFHLETLSTAMQTLLRIK
jgi:uncharacterized protein with HEPN domain